MSDLKERVYAIRNEHFKDIQNELNEIVSLWEDEYYMTSHGGKIDSRLVLGIKCLLYILIAFFDARYSRREVSS